MVHQHQSTILLFLLSLLLSAYHTRCHTIPKDPTTATSLYNDESSHPVIEYRAHTTSASLGLSTSQKKDESISKPIFLLDVSWPRVIQFYLPSSPACQNFRQHYIQTAREFRHRSVRTSVTFYAVNCAVHGSLCEYDFEILRVPFIAAFAAGSVDMEVLERDEREVNEISLSRLSEVLHSPLNAVEDLGAGINAAAKLDRNAANNDVNNSQAGGDLKQDVFSDAALSFLHDLKTRVYLPTPGVDVAGGDALSLRRRMIFHEWIDLLHWALPSQWELHNLINDVRDSMELVVQGSHEMKTILSRHEELFEDQAGWSVDCATATHGAALHDAAVTRNEESANFCGIWKLFHIVAIGVAEQNKKVLGDLHRVSPKHAADMMRNYLAEFHSALGANRQPHAAAASNCGKLCAPRTFLEWYDACELADGCQRLLSRDQLESLRLRSDAKKRGWEEMAVWLWEAHNDIHAWQHTHTQSQSSNGVDASERWPLRESCPGCWNRDGSYNHEDVYQFLKLQYWPLGVQNPRFVVLDEYDSSSLINQQHRSSWLSTASNITIMGMLLTVIMLFLNISNNRWIRSIFRNRTGAVWNPSTRNLPATVGMPSDRVRYAPHHENSVSFNGTIRKRRPM